MSRPPGNTCPVPRENGRTVCSTSTAAADRGILCSNASFSRRSSSCFILSGGTHHMASGASELGADQSIPLISVHSTSRTIPGRWAVRARKREDRRVTGEAAARSMSRMSVRICATSVSAGRRFLGGTGFRASRTLTAGLEFLTPSADAWRNTRSARCLRRCAVSIAPRASTLRSAARSRPSSI